MPKAKDRHKDERKFQCWLKDNEIARFDRLPQLDGCKGDHERVLKLMEIAEKSINVKVEENEQIKSLKSKKDELAIDLKKAQAKITELEKQPQSKVEYRDRIVEVPKSIGIEKERLQKSLSSLENNLKKLPAVIWGLKEVVLYFQVTQQARAERQSKADIQPSTNKEGDSPPQTPVMERTTKRTTTEEINEKIPMQETEDQQIICPSGKGVVSVKKECMHECQDFTQCSTYMALLKNYTRNPSNP